MLFGLFTLPIIPQQAIEWQTEDDSDNDEECGKCFETDLELPDFEDDED